MTCKHKEPFDEWGLMDVWMANGQTAHFGFKVTALFSTGIGIFFYDWRSGTIGELSMAMDDASPGAVWAVRPLGGDFWVAPSSVWRCIEKQASQINNSTCQQILYNLYLLVKLFALDGKDYIFPSWQ